MSYLLETLGRGLIGELLSAFEHQFPGLEQEEPEALEQRCAASPTSADLAVRLGVSCLRRMRLSEARQAFETALELGPPSSHPALGLACVYDELGRHEDTVRYLAIAQAHDPSDPAIPFALGFCHERQGETDAAIANYQRALALCPNLRNAHERLAALAVRRGNWGEAIACYARLARLEPDDLNVLLSLAGLYLQAGRLRDASAQYQNALLVEPEFGDEPAPGTEELVEAGRLDEAVQTLEDLVARYPGAAAFRIHLGDLYARRGDDERAVAEYGAALELQPDLLEATVKLGTQHLRRGRHVDAAQTFNRAVELNDRLMLAFVGLGVSQHSAGSEHEALASFDLAASLEPSTTLLFAEAARLHLQAERGTPRRAALECGSRFGGRGRALASACRRGGRSRGQAMSPDQDLLRESIRRHQQALLQAPHHADLHYRHGLLLRQAGQYEEAIAAFRSAVQLNPHYAKALIKLGICLKETGQTDEAIAAFRQALLLDNRYVDVHYQLGLLFAQRNKFELAAEEFEQAVSGNGRNIAFRANLALALQNIGMLDRAAATWRSICELSRSQTAPGEHRPRPGQPRMRGGR